MWSKEGNTQKRSTLVEGVRDLVNDAGVLQNHKSYDAFGNVTAETNTVVDTAFGFTGKLFDDATAQQWNLNRWYDAKVGRWLTEDPIGFEGGDINLFRYVSNEVTYAIDPTGEIAWVPIIIIVGIGGIIGADPVNAPGPGDDTYPATGQGLAFNIVCGVGANQIAGMYFRAVGRGAVQPSVGLSGGYPHFSFGVGSWPNITTWYHGWGTLPRWIFWGGGRISVELGSKLAIPLPPIPVASTAAVHAWAQNYPRTTNCITAVLRAIWVGWK